MIPTSIKEVMTTDLLTVSADMLVTDAAALMAEKSISCLLTVVDGKPDGILTERDLLHIASHDIDSTGLSIQHLLHSPVISGHADMGVYEAFDLLIEKNIRHPGIIDDSGVLIGLVTFSNLIAATDLDDFLQTKPVSAVMTQKLQTIKTNESLHNALSLMDHKSISCVVAVEEEGRPVGILTERDVASLIYQNLDFQNTLVSEVMCSPVQTVSDSAATYEVSALMQKLRFRRMVVVDSQGVLVGIVTQYDLIKGVQGKYIESLRQHLKHKSAELEGARRHLEEKKLLEHIVGHIPVVHYACVLEAHALVPYYVSPNIENLFGYPTTVCLNQKDWWSSILYKQDAERVFNASIVAQQSGLNSFAHEYRIHKADSSIAWIRDEMSIVRNADGDITEIIGSWMDITDRKSSEQGFQAVVENMLDPVVIHQDGLVVFSNPAGVRLIGAESQEQILGTSIYDYLLSEGRSGAEERVAEVVSKGITVAGVEEKFRALDGRIVIAEVSSMPIDYRGRACVLSICHDVTWRKQAEEDLAKSQEQFYQAQKMEAIGTLVGGIAHDFNNMLAGITGNLYLAKKGVQGNQNVIQKLENVENLSFRAADMIHQLLTYARKDKVKMKTLPLTPFVKETLKFLRASVPENIQMKQDICSDSLQIKGDGTQLHQVLMNLVNNSCDALEGVEAPCITIRLEAFQADELFVEKHDYFEAGVYAHISVEDNGCGIADKNLENLFEPFFTTKEIGKGTGLGLAMVFGAVKTHHGFIEVESIEGSGSTFHIYLPVAEAEGVMPAAQQQWEPVHGHGEIILLVDDEVHILETGKEVLSSLGYQVLTAADGKQAVELFKAHAEEIDLCILDVVMPVMSGDKAARAIRQVKPLVKIIFASGYDRSSQTDMGDETLFSKPFSIVELSQLIRQKLES